MEIVAAVVFFFVGGFIIAAIANVILYLLRDKVPQWVTFPISLLILFLTCGLSVGVYFLWKYLFPSTT